MVISGIIIMMPTLGINSSSFLSKAPWYFCIICKTISKWSFWCWLIMQEPFHVLIIKVQSGKVLTELRSHPHVIFSKQAPLCKPRPPRGVKYYWHSTQILLWQNSKIFSLRPFHQTCCGQDQTKMPFALFSVKPSVLCIDEAFTWWHCVPRAGTSLGLHLRMPWTKCGMVMPLHPPLYPAGCAMHLFGWACLEVSP